MAQINIRGIEDAIYLKLKVAVAQSGKTMRQFIIEMITKHVSQK